MILTDTHTHLYLDNFDQDRDLVMERAFNEGVNNILLPNIDSSTIEALHALCDKYPEKCHPMMGLHPTSVAENYEDELAIVKKNLEQRKYVAIGEIGIDLYWEKKFQTQQVIAFEQQIDWALEYDLPIVIHGRDSFDEIFEVLDRKNTENLRGVFHCFSGNIEQAKQALSYGNFKLGIGGVVTFKKSKLPEVVKHCDMEDLLLETDAPFLTPTPYRGKRNESAYIRYVAEKIAEIKETDIKTVAAITTTNAKELFRF